MVDPRKPIFDAARNAKGAGFTSEQVIDMNAAFDRAGIPREDLVGRTDLTTNSALFTFSLEGMVPEAYKDGGGVWTWAGGVTNASGHEVYPRYKDNPQPLQTCCDVSVWLLREKYLPAVLQAFSGFPLTENELAAATSFHWNTGAIGKTDWVKMVKAGDRSGAEKFLRTHYLNGGALQSRRDAEADLFFKNKWPVSLKVPVYQVAKPSYSPAWGSSKLTDLSTEVSAALLK